MTLTDEQMIALRNAFNVHKKTTPRRIDRQGNQIKFYLTFDEWFAIWLASGQLLNRGTRKGQYVMSRVDDIGHYELGNVYIQLASANSRQAKLGSTHTKEVCDAMSAARKGKPNGKKGKKHAIRPEHAASAVACAET